MHDRFNYHLLTWLCRIVARAMAVSTQCVRKQRCETRSSDPMGGIPGSPTARDHRIEEAANGAIRRPARKNRLGLANHRLPQPVSPLPAQIWQPVARFRGCTESVPTPACVEARGDSTSSAFERGGVQSAAMNRPSNAAGLLSRAGRILHAVRLDCARWHIGFTPHRMSEATDHGTISGATTTGTLIQIAFAMSVNGV